LVVRYGSPVIDPFRQTVEVGKMSSSEFWGALHQKNLHEPEDLPG
jgi:hypothetical protein